MDQLKDKKEYELSFILKDNEGESSVQEALQQHGAEVFHKSPLAETVLAYPIKKQRHAMFGFVHFHAMPDAVDSLVQSLKLNPHVLRTLLVTPPIMKEVRQQKPAGRTISTESPKEARPASATVGGALTNEALEEKLEEILR